MKKSALILILLLLFVIPSVFAVNGHIYALSVYESGTEQKGAIADIFLDIVPGNGRVFMDTYPLNELDLQISTQKAKNIACKYVNKDCSKYDFVYTLRSNSGIIGGPSAGAAIAVLTSAMLLNEQLNDSVAITGVISSGGLIQNVGGLKAKIEAAAEHNITTVLVPQLQITEENDETTNLVEYGKERNVEVIKAQILGEALYYFINLEHHKIAEEIKPSEGYTKLMKDVAELICNRTEELGREVELDEGNFTERVEKAFAENKWYTGASYCFSRNIQLQEKKLEQDGMDDAEADDLVIEYMEKSKEKRKSLDALTAKNVEVIMIINERLDMVDYFLKEFLNDKKNLNLLAVAIERYHNAEIWHPFLQIESESLADKESIKNVCLSKIKEANVVYSYLTKFADARQFDSVKESIVKAESQVEENNYEMCTFLASNANANMNIIMTVLYSDDNIDEIIALKLESAKESIFRLQNKGVFPILGYNYYEYANSLREEDKQSALMYAEYAIEMSNLDIYFEKDMAHFDFEMRKINWTYNTTTMFASGIILGLLVGIFFGYYRKKKRIKQFREKHNLN